MTHDLGHMGQFVKQHEPPANVNAFINQFYAARRTVAQTAIIIQQKQYPDVSFYQGVIDWDKMRSKTDAVIIRGGQNEWIDEKFFDNWREAKARGMKRGVYWFYDGRKSPGFQADLFTSIIRDDPPEMEVITDWERNYNGAYEGLPNVVAFMQRLELILPGIRSMMYTGHYWFIGNSNPITNAGQYNYLRTRPLHLAWYSNNAADVRIPAPWSDLLLWQYGTPAIGAEYGVQSTEIDMNYFNGTDAEFYQRYGGTQPPPTGGTMQYGKVNTSTLNIRSGPGASYADVGDLLLNDHIIATEITGGWWKLSAAYRGGWSGAPVAIPAVAWCSGAYIVPVAAPPAPAVTVASVDVDFAAKTLTLVYSDGTQRVEGIA